MMNSRSFSSDGPTITSTSLIQRIQLRDDVAWGRFVDLYGPLIWGWCRGSGLEPSDAEDVSQEVFSSVARAIGGYERTGSFRGWLWQVTRNKVLDQHRARQRAPRGTGGSDFANWLSEIPETPPEESANSQCGDPLVAGALEQIRQEFEEGTWQAFVRMVFDRQPAVEVARELGWAGADDADALRGAKRVRQAKFRVLKRLRDEFGELLDLA